MPAFPALDHRRLYRLPWNLSDNPVGWVEITNKCNLRCDGCYRKNTKHHKSLEEIHADLDLFERLRTIDSIRLSGGEPLIHPQIVEIVRLVARRGWKPLIISNGLALEKPLLRDLKKAGLLDLMFHVDSRQNRPGWLHKNEIELCELRQQIAQTVAEVGGITCNFNSTVYGNTIHHVGDIVEWAHRNIDIVNGVAFMCYRTVPCDEFDFYAQGKRIEPKDLFYTQKKERIDITSHEVVARIRERYPDFEAGAYLNGTESPDSLKWLVAIRAGTKRRIFGHLGAKGMELVTALHHYFNGTYTLHATRNRASQGRAMLMTLSWFDPTLRRALWRWLASPSAWLRRCHVQAISVVQPIDVAVDGRQSMCDGCPDVTPFNGHLVPSCRMEECLSYGRLMDMVPKKASAGSGGHAEGRPATSLQSGSLAGIGEEWGGVPAAQKELRV